MNNDAGQCGAAVSFTLPAATDNCPGVGAVTSTPVSGSVFPVGTTAVVCTVTDAHGNTQTSTFNVEMTHTNNTQLSASAAISLIKNNGQCGAVVTFTLPTATDN